MNSTKSKYILIFCLIWLSCNINSIKGQSKPDIKMFRTQDTTKNESGWYFAKSTEGNFSANLPIPFNDFTMTTIDDKIGITKSYTIGSKSKEGIKFSVTEIKPSKFSSPDLNNLIKGFEDSENKVTEINKDNYLGYSALSFHVLNKQNGAYIKYVETSKSLITMIIEFPINYELIINKYSVSFFESLKIYSN